MVRQRIYAKVFSYFKNLIYIIRLIAFGVLLLVLLLIVLLHEVSAAYGWLRDLTERLFDRRFISRAFRVDEFFFVYCIEERVG